LNSNFKDPSWKHVRSIRSGLDSDERHKRDQVFGKNLIDIEQKSIPQLLFDEAFHPFYVFQIASLILWSLDEYYYYATCIFIISVVSITTTLLDTRATMKRLREISRFECDVRALRNGFWRNVRSSELVPGDVYEVSDPALTQFPCDSLLLAGDCIVNESMLTGESVPVSKVPATDESLRLLDLSASSINPEVAKHFLFSGTKIIRARRPQDGEDEEAVALAIVVRTGFNTTKGALVRSMLFPKPSGFKFYRDSFRYISVMAGIAGIGFIASFVNFVRLKLAWHLIVVRALDLITIVVPPALPATLTIGTSFALSRLKKKQIFCISPQRVNVGGKIDIMCFDKTGTLTEDGLDVLGIRVVHQPASRFSDILTDASAVLPGATYERDPTVDYRVHKAALYTMATCHSLRVIDNQLVGDPLDFKMFDFTGWSFEEGGQGTTATDEDEHKKLSPSVARPPAGMEYDIDDIHNKTPLELGVLKSFEFVSQLRRSSVIVRQFGAPSGDVYVKGAPECMKDICDPESFPIDYDELLNYYTHRGFRVIACATKHIPKLSWVKVQKMRREEAESELAFVGFIIFENKLKPTTTEIINELNEAGIRNVMCTGDNILTAISVARECHLIDRQAHCFVPHFHEGNSQDPNAQLHWESVDNAIYSLDNKTLLPLPPPAEGDASLPYDVANLRNYSLAISGDVFRWIVEFGTEDLLRRMLACGQVYARMSPDEKHELVEKFQSIDYCCGFCGDGANDCGALKAADVGISLSEAEASVAAPFTSRVFDISCVPEVIREGRAALVTSFCCFKYMSLYSAIQFTSVSFLYASASNLADFQFLFIDLLLILPIAIFMGWTGAYPVLSQKKPTASLVSRKVLTPLLGQVVICIIVQLIGFEAVQRQSWYVMHPSFSSFNEY
jgi:cation-transporting ATPase 13A2